MSKNIASVPLRERLVGTVLYILLFFSSGLILLEYFLARRRMNRND